MTIFSHPPTLVFCFLLPLFFPRFFAANKIFFSSFSRSSCFDQNDRPLENGGEGREEEREKQRKGKKTKKYTTTTTTTTRARKEENEEVIKPAAMFSILSLSVSLRVCIYFIITKRELKMVSNYIFYAYVATTPRDQKSIGPRSLGVKLAPGSKIKKATAMHAKANVALDSSTSVTSSLGA